MLLLKKYFSIISLLYDYIVFCSQSCDLHEIITFHYSCVSLCYLGTPLTADSQHGHLVLQGTPTCMEGFKMDPDSKNCSQSLYHILIGY